MIQPPLSALPANLTLTHAVPMTRAWQVGQLLQALAQSDTVQGKVNLRVGTQTLEANTQTPIRQGTRLTLEVVRTGDQPVLKIVTPAAAPPPMQAVMRNLAPQQIGLPQVFANLVALLRPDSAMSARGTLPAPALAMVKTLIEQLAGTERRIDAKILQRALRESGQFLESQLARGSTATDAGDLPRRDLKAQLFRLAQTLRQLIQPGTRSTPAPASAQAPARPAPGAPPAAAPVMNPPATSASPASAPPPPLRGAPPLPQARVAATLAMAEQPERLPMELLRQVEGAIARISMNQIASITPEGDARPTWLLELPIRHGTGVDLFQLRIEDEQGRDADSDTQTRQWSVWLAFDLERLGPVQARVLLRGEQVSTTFWSANAETTAAFTRHLEALSTGLRSAGLEVGQILCHTGVPPHPRPPAPPLMRDRA